jgi:hypothetical protein
MYFILVWMMGIPMMWTWSRRAMVGALDIYDDAPIITYLQIGEVLIGLTSKENDHVVHRAQ